MLYLLSFIFSYALHEICQRHLNPLVPFCTTLPVEETQFVKVLMETDNKILVRHNSLNPRLSASQEVGR